MGMPWQQTRRRLIPQLMDKQVLLSLLGPNLHLPLVIRFHDRKGKRPTFKVGHSESTPLKSSLLRKLGPVHTKSMILG
jgi:hypothetical protein